MRAVLMDIEGTTTSISFVYDELFPWAREHMRAFVASDTDTAALTRELAMLCDEIEADRAAGRDVRVEIPAGDPDAAGVREALASRALELMDRDVKSTGLKSLQGRIWEEGYRAGRLLGHVNPDVPVAMRRRRDAGVRIAIYSSGSVAAQRLIFGCSVAGDLTDLIEAYFDTTTGPKKEAASYERIAEQLGLPTADVRFLTDNPDEARAAARAGMDVVVLDRPGNADPGEIPWRREPDFTTIEPASTPPR
jgi:enolase-phosphatase E1